MRNRLKPNLNLETIQHQLLENIVTEYNKTGSINKTAKSLELSNMKVRKALITAGVYSNETSEEVEQSLATGKSVEDIATMLGITVSAVYGYIPYKITAYNLDDRSVNADRAARYRERKKALRELKSIIQNNGDWRIALWKVITIYQGQRFRTSGRGKEHSGAVGFTYELKVSERTGQTTNEILFSTRGQGKSVTKSSVERALDVGLKIQQEEGCVSGSKKLGTFGSSYLYAMFLKWGLINDKPPF